MTTAHNLSLIIIRGLALLFLCVGVMGLGFVFVTVLFFATGWTPWLVEPALSYAAQSVFGSPVWIIVGTLLMWRSKLIAAFICKHCQDDRVA